jgi:uncharacterized membrane protein
MEAPNMKRNDMVSLALIGTGFILGGLYYGDLPDPMPTHYGIDGNPDRFTALPYGAFIVPLAALIAWGVMKLVPRISPREFSMSRFMRAYEAVIVSVMGFLAVVQFIVLRSAMDPSFNQTLWIQLIVGAILLVVANYMTKTRPNFFFGIRTPWTLANEEVWYRTHRQGAWWLAGMGITAMVTAPFGFGLYLLLGLTGIAVVWLFAYSYIVYSRLERPA